MLDTLKKYFKIKFFLIIVLGIFFVYLGYQVYSVFFSPIETELVLFVEDVAESMTFENAFIVRKENVIKDQRQGVVTYLAEDGEKIAKGEKIVSFYRDSSDATKVERLTKIDDEIVKLKQLNAFYGMMDANPTAIDKQISHELRDLLTNLSDKSYKKFKNKKERLLYLMNERQLATHQVKNFSNRIDELENKKKDFKVPESHVLGELDAEVSGYFTRHVDGYEDLVDYDKITSVLPSQLDEITKVHGHKDNDFIGKIVSDQNWYIAVNVKNKDLTKFKEQSDLEVLVPSVFSKRIPAKIEAINQPDVDSDAAVILKCDYLNEDIILARNECVQVVFEKHDGLRINKKALHEKVESKTVKDESTGQEKKIEKTVKGVYVLYAGELIFKEVVPVYADVNYVICDPSPGEESLFSGKTIKVYDQVVTKGKGLYDGKFVR